MKTRNALIAAAVIATFTAGASAAYLNGGVAADSAIVTALKADEGVPQNLVTAMKADEGVPQNLVASFQSDEGVPQNLIALNADEGVPQNLVTA